MYRIYFALLVLLLAFAKGVYFNTRIRDRYPHREVFHEEETADR